ncbi:hypothetical protein RFI_08270 [Reticulomyxa filosa]|uniref:Uncharacterized protein n=1 Tax=Reticulomyxa filosa TaxID=46433 RepID=X6NS87_RETFI|nr:hypothetical protein RFI_08270 [Reticulomyxa filosa]|eukprot:ETO28856.1 hypothetical protein RFI_08270 [Reticulomyxa filosa]
MLALKHVIENSEDDTYKYSRENVSLHNRHGKQKTASQVLNSLKHVAPFSASYSPTAAQESGTAQSHAKVQENADKDLDIRTERNGLGLDEFLLQQKNVVRDQLKSNYNSSLSLFSHSHKSRVCIQNHNSDHSNGIAHESSSFVKEVMYTAIKQSI